MNEKLYKEELRNLLRQEYGMSEKGATDALNKFFGLIVKALEEERYVKIKGLGIFKLIDVESRKSVDVNTGNSIEIPEHRKVSYSVDSALKSLINRPFSHFEPVELRDGSPVMATEEEEGANEAGAMEGAESSVAPLPVSQADLEGEDELAMATPVEENRPAGIHEEMTDKEEVALDKAVYPKSPSRREELRRLEREMDREERNNKVSLLLIATLMLLLVLAGLLFVLAPEFLERLFY